MVDLIGLPLFDSSKSNNVSPEPLVPLAQAQPSQRGERLWGREWLQANFLVLSSCHKRLSKGLAAAADKFSRASVYKRLFQSAFRTHWDTITLTEINY